MSILSQEFVFCALGSQEEYPIDFDDIWGQLGYSRKSNAKRALLSSGYVVDRDFQILLNDKPNLKSGRPEEKIFLTVNCYKGFCDLTKRMQENAKNRQILGGIYVLRDKGNKALKIGFSVDVDKRVKVHATSNPFLTEIFRFSVTSIKSEGRLHRQLISYRITGTKEWYKDLPQVISIVKAFSVTP